MRRLLPLVLLGCFLFYSCNNNEEENYVEEIAIANVFYEDFSIQTTLTLLQIHYIL